MLIVKDESRIEVLAELLREGKIVAFPTETVYGVGTNALIKESVYKIYKIKGRIEEKPLSLHIGTLENLGDIVELDFLTKRLLLQFFPGPINIIVRKKSNIPEWIGTKDTLGIRFPSLPICQKLLRLARVPVVATSANISGSEEPKTAEDVMRMLGDKIDAILDWGPVTFGKPSTVVNISSGNIEVIREGPVDRKLLEDIISELNLRKNMEGL